MTLPWRFIGGLLELLLIYLSFAFSPAGVAGVLFKSIKIDSMGKLLGALQISGTVGGITFVKTKYGIVARAKSSLDKEKFYSYESMEGSRQTSKEFGRAAKISQRVRKALAPVAKAANDGTVHFRLNKAALSIMQTDMANDKGKRRFDKGEVSQLKGFQWNKDRALDSVLKANYTVHMDKESGAMSVVVPAFDVAKSLKKPKNATHYQIVAGGLSFNEAEEEQEVVVNNVKSGMLELKSGDSEELNLDVSVAVNRGEVVVMGVGIVFYIKEGKQFYELREGTCFELAEIGVSGNEVEEVETAGAGKGNLKGGGKKKPVKKKTADEAEIEDTDSGQRDNEDSEGDSRRDAER